MIDRSLPKGFRLWPAEINDQLSVEQKAAILRYLIKQEQEEPETRHDNVRRPV